MITDPQFTRCLQCGRNNVAYERHILEEAPLFCGRYCEGLFLANNGVRSDVKLERKKYRSSAQLAIVGKFGIVRIRVMISGRHDGNT